MKKIVVLGSTGSIGRQTLEIVKSYPNDLKIVGLSTNQRAELLKKQAREFQVKNLSVGGRDLDELASLSEAEIIVMAVSGMAALRPMLAAIRAKKRICFANKEVLVVAGELILKEAQKFKAELIPIDSEISAIFQSLKNEDKKGINKLILTMGKGKLALMNKRQLAKVTLKEILNRKVWDLGLKIAIDSATGINKSLEVIEASQFFGIPYSQIEILVHPQYLCHSLVEFINGSTIAEFGVPDMKRYIQYALFYPERKTGLGRQQLDLTAQNLTFEKPPFEKFPCLKLGYDCLRKGGTLPAVMHGADEVAVKAFIDGKISFVDIYDVIKKTMTKIKIIKNPTLKQIIEAEKLGQEEARRYT